MEEFAELVTGIMATVDQLKRNGYDIPFFRGHGSTKWQLTPALGRRPGLSALENTLYYDVLIRAGSLIPAHRTTWDTLFIMQHHRIPTRLLDWTENFAVALYFAVRDFRERAAIWILNPFELNQQQIGNSNLLHPQSDMYGEYFDYFITGERKFEGDPDVIAILPNKTNERVVAQKAVFTLHWNLEKPLETVCPSHVYKFELSDKALEQAEKFLELAGINEYALFPDLDGLARWLKVVHGI
jgi:hypothetical protein